MSSSTYNSKNQLLSSAGGGPLRWRGTLNELGNVAFTTVTVNDQPARMLAGNVFEADLQMTTGNNTVTIEAMDVSGNVTTKSYQANVSGSGATYIYDLNGNLTQKVEGSDTWGYEWNPENQLTRVTKNTIEQARYKYDPLGRRVEKVAGGVTTTWTYDGEDIFREANGSTTLKYAHGPGIDEPLASDDGSALSYLHADGLASVVKTTSAAGVATLTRQYDAWGTLQAGTTTPGYAFTGREWDPETSLTYYRARYLDSRIGRFVSQDPIGFDAGDPDFYVYVVNNPITATDPDGLLKIPQLPPWVQWPWRIITLHCLRQYWQCTQRIKEMCAGYWNQNTCEITGYECCDDQINKCSMDLFRFPGDPEREAPNPCYPQKKCSEESQ